MFQSLSRIFSALTPMQRSFVSSFAGFIFYGSWAYWVNSDYGSLLALKAAYVQGGYSFAITFIMTLLMELIFKTIHNLLSNYLLVIWITVVSTCCIIFSTSWWLNVIAGTPRVFETVILGYVIGAIYSVVYVYGLGQSHKLKIAD